VIRNKRGDTSDLRWLNTVQGPGSVGGENGGGSVGGVQSSKSSVSEPKGGFTTVTGGANAKRGFTTRTGSSNNKSGNSQTRTDYSQGKVVC